MTTIQYAIRRETTDGRTTIEYRSTNRADAEQGLRGTRGRTELVQREVGPWIRVSDVGEGGTPPPGFYSKLPCGHPPDPVSWWNGKKHVCHCGTYLNPEHAVREEAAPGPLAKCTTCDCWVACVAP